MLNRASGPHRVRRLLAATLLVATPALSACGFNYATDNVYTPAHGANARDGKVDALGAVIVSQGDGKGAFIASFANNDTEKADEFTGLSGDVQGTAKPTPIPAGGFVNLAEQNGVEVTGDFGEGDFVEVTVEFKNAEPATMNVPVVAAKDQWEPYGTPSESASPSGGASDSQGASGGASESAPASESADASH